MALRLPSMPAEGVFDGEIVAFADGRPPFPLVCDRLLHRDRTIPLTFVIFDVLVLDGASTTHLPYRDRRELLDALDLGDGPWFVAETFEDGPALFAAVCEQGMEGVVAKHRSRSYRPADRAWIKTKNKAYWRYGEELDSLRRSLERRAFSSRGCHLLRALQGLLKGVDAIEGLQHAGDLKNALDEWGGAEHEVEPTVSFGRGLLRVHKHLDRR